MLDNVMITSGMTFNLQESTTRNFNLMNDYLQNITHETSG